MARSVATWIVTVLEGTFLIIWSTMSTNIFQQVFMAAFNLVTLINSNMVCVFSLRMF